MRRPLALLGIWLAVVILAIGAGTWETAKAQGAYPGIAFTCSADNIGATLTRLKAGGGGECLGPLDGNRRYVTDVVAQSTTTTVGGFILRYGTGTNCGTGTVSLFPSAATAARWASPPNTAAPTVISFRTPLIIPTGKDLCVLGLATNTTTMQVNGYVAP